MSFYADALAFTLSQEGGWSNNKADAGGATMKGVTQGVYDAHRDLNHKPRRSVRFIDDAELQNIYRPYWQALPGIDAMAKAAAMILFDISVNSGPARAKAWLKECGPDPVRLIARRRAFYTALIAAKPSQKVFQKGWENRCKALERAVGLA